MNIKTIAITSFGRFLSSVSVWQQIRNVVEMMDDKALSGTQKKQKAMEILLSELKNFSNFLVGLLIELAVAEAKAKLGKL